MSQLTLFDYGALDPETRIVVQQEDKEFDRNMEDAGVAFVRACHNVFRINDRLRYKRKGQGFVDWCAAKRLPTSTAYRMLEVARMFPESGNIAIESREALYLLASPSTPPDAREEALARAEAGEEITHARAKEIVAEHRETDSEIPSDLPPLLPFADLDHEDETEEEEESGEEDDNVNDCGTWTDEEVPPSKIEDEPAPIQTPLVIPAASPEAERRPQQEAVIPSAQPTFPTATTKPPAVTPGPLPVSLPPPRARPFYPYSDRLIRWNRLIWGEAHVIDVEHGGIANMLAEPEKWDWAEVHSYLLPQLRGMIEKLNYFVSEIEKHARS